MRANSTHSHADRGLDPYFSSPAAIYSLIGLEPDMPQLIHEPACGDGALAAPLVLDAGKDVIASDIKNYGYPGTIVQDYLTAPAVAGVQGIVTNPPYKHTKKFVSKACAEAPYVAMLLPLSFLEGVNRKPWFEANRPARVWVSSRRLPMMHRYGWTGPKAPSNKCHAWFVWEIGDESAQIRWYDWKLFSQK